MARRSLSDQRHLLVELELDEGELLAAARHPPRHDRSHDRHDPYAYDDEDHSHASSRRYTAQDARAAAPRRSSLEHKTPSPYKLKQKVLSSRSRQALDHEDDHHHQRQTRRPSAAAMPSPLLVIADALRDAVSQRARVLLDVQDALRRPPPVSSSAASGRSTSTATSLLPPAAVKLLNRLRSLTLSVVEMVRYLHEQLASATSETTATVWALQLEGQETLARLCASDADALLAFPALTFLFERQGVSALRNPLLDGVALDSSELLLCSCQALGGATTASSSLFALVVARLEAFAVQVRRQYPAWQILPHDRVARALLDLLESESKANATRMLPSYLRPEGSAVRGSGGYAAAASTISANASASDSEEEDRVARVKPVAWAAEPLLQPPPPRRASVAHVLAESPRAPLPAAPPSKPRPSTTASAAAAPHVAEPKTAHENSSAPYSAKKTKKLQEQSVTLSSLGMPSAPSTAMARAGTKDPVQFASDRLVQTALDEQRTFETIASALDKLPQFSLEALGLAVPQTASETAVEPEVPAPVAAADETPVHMPASEVRALEPTAVALSELALPSPLPVLPTPLPSALSTPLPLQLPSAIPSALPTPHIQDDGPLDDAVALPSGLSELSRILSLCRDVQVAAIDLGERLRPTRYDAETTSSYSPRQLLPAIRHDNVASPPKAILSTRYLERELKMLRRCFRLWAAARTQRHARLDALYVASAARRIGRFGRLVLRRKREREAERERARRDEATTRIQRRWRVWRAWQAVRARQRAFHLVDRCFKRCRFFTRVSQRRRCRETACRVLQRWWRDTRRMHLLVRQGLLEAERCAAAARHLQAFVRERALRHSLAEAQETSRRFHMLESIKATKARRDEAKRRQLETKRLAELRTAMQLALRESEAKWQAAQATAQRLEALQAETMRQAEQEALALRRRHAREQIDRFLERGVLKRRLRAQADATAALARAKRALEWTRERLERQHRADAARALLRTRVAGWKAQKTQLSERQRASDTLWRLQRQRVRERDQALDALHAQIRARVAHVEVLTTTETASQRVAAATFDARLAAKHEEARRLRRQAARERVAGFVERRWRALKLERDRREAEARHQRELVEQRERHELQERERTARQALRTHSERVVAQQLARVCEKEAGERVARAAQQATQAEAQHRGTAELEAARLRAQIAQMQQQQRRRDQLVEFQRRAAQRKAQQLADKHDRLATEARWPSSATSTTATTATTATAAADGAHLEKQHAELLAQLQRHQQEREDRERQLALERQARAKLLDVVLDTQRVAQLAATDAVAMALEGVRAQCERLRLAATYEFIMACAWQREVCVRWRQFVRRRQTLAALATHVLWPQAANVPSERDAMALPPSQQQQQLIEQRDSRLAELRRLAAVRRVQRGWHASRKRLRQARRLEVKREEDALVARAKRRGSSIGDAELMAAASAARTLTRWARRLAHTWQLRFQAGDAVVVRFAGGRAWAHATSASTALRLRFDRAVTRRVLLAVDPAAPTARADLDRLLRELGADLAPIAAAAKTSPRTVAQPDGALELGDVDELELPLFALATRQLSKTRSMAKRKQLLDAKATSTVAVSGDTKVLTVFDAVESASLEDAQFLLLQGEDLAAREPCHARSALHMLAFSGESVMARVALLRFLVLRAKLDLDARDDAGATPLLTFATHGSVALAEAALQLAPELWRASDREGRNALHCACAHDQPECVELLRRHVVSEKPSDQRLRELHAADKRGVTPLHVLAAHGHSECLRAMVAPLDRHRCAELLDQRDRGGCTPLHLAVAHCHGGFVRELLACGASASVGDAWQRRPLHYATRLATAAALELITVLADQGAAELDAADARGDTALHWAAASGRADVVRQLLLLGADPHVLNGDWETPARVAAARGHGECARLLLPASASVDDLRRHQYDTSAATHELASAHSYYQPHAAAAAAATTATAGRKGGEIDWDELQQGVELVEESGHFSSEDDRDGGEEDGEEDDARWYS